MTLESPLNTATLFMSAPTIISQNATQATFGVAIRHRSSVEAAK